MSAARRGSPTRPALLGLAFGLAGIVAYFVLVLRFGGWLPEVRNSALPNLALIAVGLVLSAVALRRARAAGRSARGRRLAPVLAVLNVALSGAFCWLLFVGWALPAAAGPTVGAPAPDFALVDQERRPVRLADFRGSPLLLVFYRGHW